MTVKTTIQFDYQRKAIQARDVLAPNLPARRWHACSSDKFGSVALLPCREWVGHAYTWQRKRFLEIAAWHIGRRCHGFIETDALGYARCVTCGKVDHDADNGDRCHARIMRGTRKD